MRRHLTAVLGLCVLAGCATEPWAYDRPGTTLARLDQDLESCRREAYRPGRFAITSSGRVDREVLNRCMERKGYTARRDQ